VIESSSSSDHSDIDDEDTLQANTKNTNNDDVIQITTDTQLNSNSFNKNVDNSFTSASSTLSECSKEKDKIEELTIEKLLTLGSKNIFPKRIFLFNGGAV
jgi:hypothetical protein